jgi:hypothetical protein
MYDMGWFVMGFQRLMPNRKLYILITYMVLAPASWPLAVA